MAIIRINLSKFYQHVIKADYIFGSPFKATSHSENYNKRVETSLVVERKFPTEQRDKFLFLARLITPSVPLDIGGLEN